MNKIDVSDFKKVVVNPKDKSATVVPQMPILISTGDGYIWETDSIRGAASTIIGDSYLENISENTQWYKRLELARKQSMFAIGRDVFAKVYDERHGILSANYAVSDEDPDYTDDVDPGEPILIRIDNDKLLLLSLVLIGAIEIYEREDSYQFKPFNYNCDNSLTENKGCNSCIHKVKEIEQDMIYCPVYRDLRDSQEGRNCSSYVSETSNKTKYEGGEYICLSAEYDIQYLINISC